MPSCVTTDNLREHQHPGRLPRVAYNNKETAIEMNENANRSLICMCKLYGNVNLQFEFSFIHSFIHSFLSGMNSSPLIKGVKEWLVIHNVQVSLINSFYMCFLMCLRILQYANNFFHCHYTVTYLKSVHTNSRKWLETLYYHARPLVGDVTL